jgi:hypothetical protein
MLAAGTTGIGLSFQPHDVQVYNRTGSTTLVGNLVMFDHKQTATETTNSIEGRDDGAYSNVVQPDADMDSRGFWGICLEAAPDNALMRIRVRGRVDALVRNTAALNEPLNAEGGQDSLSAATSGGNKCLGIPEATTPDNNAALIPIIFNGIEGLGIN